MQDEPRRIRPRLIFCGGEVLDAATRCTIEDAFSAPLVDFYGAHEFNLLAWQCPNGSVYHVCDDNVLVEIVGEDGRAVRPGEIGEVVATSLHSYTMPFVRYRTGDLAIHGAESCGCGQPFSTLREIQGRGVDYLRLPEGAASIRTPLPYISPRESGMGRAAPDRADRRRRIRLNINRRGGCHPKTRTRARMARGSLAPTSSSSWRWSTTFHRIPAASSNPTCR
jgi:hypothetical protein